MVSFQPEEDREVVTSKFNPAAYKMSRIHNYSGLIDDAKMNPSLWNPQFNCLNLVVWFKATCVIYSEVFIKFNGDEVKKCEMQRLAIEKLLDKYNPLIRNNKKGMTLDKPVLDIFVKYIDRYEKLVRGFQDIHGLDTPNVEDDEGL